MGCTDFVVKYLLFIVNTCVTIYGIIIVGVASAVLLYSKTLAEVVPVVNKVIPIYFIISGCIITLIASVGSWGAISQTPWLLNLYAGFMLFLSAVQTLFVIIVYELVGRWEEDQNDFIELFLQDPDYTHVVNIFQAIYQCCGTTGSDSYELLEISLPFTCCPGLDIPDINNVNDIPILHDILQNINETEHTCIMEDAYPGCNPILIIRLRYIYNLTVYFAILLICSELTVIIFALYLAQHIRNEKCTGKRERLTVRG